MSLLGLATLPAYSIMVALSAGIGLPYGPINPLLNYAMQTRSPGHLRGRVVGALTSLGYAAGPLGYVVAGPLVERLGVRPAFLGAHCLTPRDCLGRAGSVRASRFRRTTSLSRHT